MTQSLSQQSEVATLSRDNVSGRSTVKPKSSWSAYATGLPRSLFKIETDDAETRRPFIESILRENMFPRSDSERAGTTTPGVPEAGEDPKTPMSPSLTIKAPSLPAPAHVAPEKARGMDLSKQFRGICGLITLMEGE